MRIGIAGTQNNGCALQIARKVEQVVKRPDQASSEGKQARVALWISAHELRRKTRALRKAAEGDLTGLKAGLDDTREVVSTPSFELSVPAAD